jgi:hypothetical protein
VRGLEWANPSNAPEKLVYDGEAVRTPSDRSQKALFGPESPKNENAEIELDEEEGYLVYEVDLKMGNEEYEVYVDAGSGKVLCTERED